MKYTKKKVYGVCVIMFEKLNKEERVAKIQFYKVWSAQEALCGKIVKALIFWN